MSNDNKMNNAQQAYDYTEPSDWDCEEEGHRYNPFTRKCKECGQERDDDY